MIEALLYYLPLGALAGTLAGMLGIGGGLVIVPALAITFKVQGFEPSVIMPLALGTSLLTIVVTSLSSIRTHHQHGASGAVAACYSFGRWGYSGGTVRCFFSRSACKRLAAKDLRGICIAGCAADRFGVAT